VVLFVSPLCHLSASQFCVTGAARRIRSLALRFVFSPTTSRRNQMCEAQFGRSWSKGMAVAVPLATPPRIPAGVPFADPTPSTTAIPASQTPSVTVATLTPWDLPLATHCETTDVVMGLLPCPTELHATPATTASSMCTRPGCSAQRTSSQHRQRSLIGHL
jgi:hypothetical protein